MNNQPTRDELNRKKINAVKDCAPTLSHAQIAMISLDLTSLTGKETVDDESSK